MFRTSIITGTSIAWRFIETFLVDKRAANIRNLIAHGYYLYKTNNFGYAILLVFILLKLSNLSVGMK